ncbi:MAG: hypothetical protein OEM97_02245 [Acidimicrobiia bacterium]|nr:hypothetical protein [Acidimicrobiia bacterium]
MPIINVSLSATQLVLLLIGLLLVSGLVAAVLLRRFAARVPPSHGSSIYQDVSGQVLSQLDAHRGHAGEHSDQHWDGVRRIETGETNTGL